jgi:parvulin-like peptidyl-prolyl isomerase
MMKPVLQQMVEREMIMQDAIARIPPRAMDQVRQSAQREIESQINKRKQQLGLRTDEELQVYLSKQGLSLESLKRQVERGMIADEYLRSRMSQKIQAIDREQLLEYYRNNSKLFELPEITWQYIFISNIAGARHLGAGESPNIERSHQHAIRIFELAQKCQTKEDFQKLAESHTDGPVANGDGEGGRRGEIRPREIEEYLYRMQPGQVGATEAANGRGYHIFRVLTKNAKGRKNFEEACPEIRRKIQNEIYSSEREKFLRELKVKTFVKYEL